MACEQRIVLTLKQELKLSQVIDISNLLSVPDEILNTVLGAVSYNPDHLESILREKKKEKPVSDNSEKVQSIYASLTFSKINDVARSKNGLIISPDINSLESCFKNYTTAITPDVTYIGRENSKPEIVFSDHLKGSLSLNLVMVDPLQYPETSKLISHLKKFDEWKRNLLRNSYVVFGDIQREFLKDLDRTKSNIFLQKNLAEKLNVNSSTVSRVLSNRWVEARGVAGNQKFFYAKDFFVKSDDLKKYILIPKLNEILGWEFVNKKAYSDGEIAREVNHIARRTVVKYRKESDIPNILDRNKVYQSGKKETPYIFS